MAANSPSHEEIRLRILEVLIPTANARSIDSERLLISKAAVLEHYVKNGYSSDKKSLQGLEEAIANAAALYPRQ